MLKTLARQKTSRQFNPPNPPHPTSDPPHHPALFSPPPCTTPWDWLPALKVAQRRCFMDFNADGAIALH